jgi:transposase
LYRDPTQWAYIRRLVLDKGESLRSVSRKTGLSRPTVRKMLARPRPSKAGPPNGVVEDLLEAAQSLAAERNSSNPVVHRRRALGVWGRARDLVLNLDPPRGAALLRDIADAIDGRSTTANLPNSRCPSDAAKGLRAFQQGNPELRGAAAREWMLHVLQGEIQIETLRDLDSVDGFPLLLARARDGSLRQRKKATVVLAGLRGIPIRTIATSLCISRVSARKYLRVFAAAGVEALFANRRSGFRRAQDEPTRQAVFALLHEPPSMNGINRTTWRMADLTRVLHEKGTPVCAQIVREITKSAGWRWRKARKVLTSNDPEYRAKVQRIQSILAELHESEAFFSIDEFGPFVIRAHGGRMLVGRGTIPTVPQRQKSKGSLIMTAALELSSNQLTYFYSPRKDTGEMLRMLAKVREEYAWKSRIYLSWDAASWHISKLLYARVAEHNEAITKRTALGPLVELAPLPVGAQFLNVIESVFSGMARAILANSNYGSLEEARAAIERYVRERNERFRQQPKRAGRKIWGAEREPACFSSSNNCKDPYYR